MVHVDVRSIDNPAYVGPDYTNVVVEVSTDGGEWKRLAVFPVFPHTDDLNATQQKINARQFAKAWIDGARYAGAEVRATSFGEGGV